MNPTLDLSEINQKIGPLFIAGMPGPEIDDFTISMIKDYHLGGIILFKRNIIEPVQLARMCRDIQRLSMKHSGVPMFLAIDQEGGRVARLKEPFTQFPGNAAIGENPFPKESALHFATTTAREMSLVGLNMNLAPVLDIAQRDIEAHLAGRCFSSEPSLVAKLGKIVINTLQQGRIMAVAKHFPGLGKANLDPHLNLPTIEAPLEELESIHLIPFAGAIEVDVSAIMSSHAVYPALDPGIPATLSRKIMTDLLRKKMQFDGLVISDDLEMGAISNERGLPQGVLDAFGAGVDLILICKDQTHIINSMELIRDKLLRGDISHERLERSLERIALYKKRFLYPLKKVYIKAVREYFKTLQV
ncbi:MAG TPA: beta-N-acetylhexosaminidase [Desulfatiglandales bacterium]|nr:beta-N-acetylhexosaminidase [Desulfatiglandales bacterium]